MPLKSKKSPAKRKPNKPLVKAKTAKPKPKSIFWKILEERKLQKEHGPPQPYKTDHHGHHPTQRHEQFAKFAGPRRRAA